MFAWIFHRVTGILLIFVVGIKMLTGFGLSGRLSLPSAMSDLHAGRTASTVLDIVLVLLFIFHSLYGIRISLIDLGIKNERPLFWGFSGAGVVIFAIAVLFIYLLPR